MGRASECERTPARRRQASESCARQRACPVRLRQAAGPCRGHDVAEPGARAVKILLLADIFPPKKGGSGRWLWELYRRLRDVDVHVAAAEMPGAEEFDRLAELPISRLPLRFSNWGAWDPRGGWRYARAFRQLNNLVSRVQPDVIHCGKCLPEGLLALAVKRW